VLLAPAFALVLAMPETVRAPLATPARPDLPRVPREAWPVFLPAALSVFAGFAVLGLFSSVVPAFMGQILGVANPAATGLLVAALFAASLAGSNALAPLVGSRGPIVGSGSLVIGMAVLAPALALPSLPLLVAAAAVAGLGQGTSFRRGLEAISGAAPPARRAEVASSYFLVAYLALSLPVVGVGLLTQLAGLRVAGLAFAALVGVIGAGALLVTRRMARRPNSAARSEQATQRASAA
jgi:MFS family permease